MPDRGTQITRAFARERMMPVVSVVIPAYKRPELLAKAVRAVFVQDLPKDQYELIVVDSSPDDGNITMLVELSGCATCQFRWFRKHPEGPGPSRNLGVRYARGEFIAFTDSDCQPAADWLRRGLEAFRDGVGLVQGRTRPDPEGKPGVLSWYISVEREGFIYECCNILYRRAAVEQVGDFRPSHFPSSEHPPGGEDIDLAWRVKHAGWTSVFAADAVVYHEVVRISARRWLLNEQLFIWPFLVGKFPELRPYFFRRYFYDKAQAYFMAMLAGACLTALHPVSLVLTVPYVLYRGLEPTATLHGPLRLVRVASYFARDAVSFLVLVIGSVRFRSLLL